MRNKGKYRIVIEVLSIIFGSLLIAIGANTLLIPANLLSGGVIGICMILYHFFIGQWECSILSIIFHF